VGPTRRLPLPIYLSAVCAPASDFFLSSSIFSWTCSGALQTHTHKHIAIHAHTYYEDAYQYQDEGR
jgi:hypothetical protein